MKRIGFHSLLPSNQIDHKRWVDHNKGNDEEAFEPIVLQMFSSYDVYFFESFRTLRPEPLI